MTQPESKALPSLVPPEDNDEPTRTDTRVQPLPLSVRTHQRARFTAMTGVRAGMVLALESDVTVLGRGPEVDLRFDEVGVSRRHVRVTRTRRSHYLIEDLSSKNGTHLNGLRITRPEILEVGDRLQIGAIVLQFGFSDEAEEELARRLFEASTRDPLTRSYNRRYLIERFDAELSYAKRHGSALSVILLDLDMFKSVNDEHGHGSGDRVLRAVSDRVLELIRKEDTFGRYGGEEFAVLVRGLGRDGVARFAERIRRSIESMRVLIDPGEIGITISLGIASSSECGPDPTQSDLFALADRRLYLAKERGRNQVCSVDPPVSNVVPRA
jgi:diguanylate cyclase (GGDEF)-like protein